MTSTFDLEHFQLNSRYEDLTNLLKADWKNLADAYEIPYTAQMTKEVLKSVVVEELVTRKILSAVAIEVLTPMSHGVPNPVTHKRLTQVGQTYTEDISPSLVAEADPLALERLKYEY